MFAVLGEHQSDADSLAVLVKRISNIQNQRILTKGLKVCGPLVHKSCRVIKELNNRGATKFIICHDSDGDAPHDIVTRINGELAKGTCSALLCQIVVPVQEIEAWIIADEDAIKTVIRSLSIPNTPNPESIRSPKEWLVRYSGRVSSRPLYVPSLHNAKVAEVIDLGKLERKCPSFTPLKNFVSGPP